MEPRPIYIGTVGMVDAFRWFEYVPTISDDYFDKPYAEDTVSIKQGDAWTFSFRMESKMQKTLYRLLKRGNNWRRMHGLKAVRVPEAERRKRGHPNRHKRRICL